MNVLYKLNKIKMSVECYLSSIMENGNGYDAANDIKP